ncbi:MAG: O-antigen ligase [Planctomycetota bacterium]
MSTAVLASDSPALPSAKVKIWAKRIILAFGVCCCFWAMHHEIGLSPESIFLRTFQDSEYRTTDRVESLNFLSALGRIGMAGIGCLCLVIPTREKLKYDNFLVFVLLTCLLFTCASVAWSINLSLTVKKLIVLCMFLTGAVGMARQCSFKDLVIILVIVSVSQSLGGLAVECAYGFFKPHTSDYRFIGTCHPNTNAILGTVCCLGAKFFSPKDRLGLLTVLIFCFGFAIILLTKSRTSLAAMMLSLVMIRFVTFHPKSRTFLTAGSIFLGITLLFGLMLSPRYVQDQFLDKISMGRTKDVASLTGRLPLWETLIEDIQHKPVLGHGYLAYWSKRQIEELGDKLKWEIPHGHNLYLDVIIDTGIVGLLFLLLLYGSIFQIAASAYQRTRDPGIAFTIGMLTFCVIHGFGESLFKLPTFAAFSLTVVVLRLAFWDGRQEVSTASSESAAAGEPRPQADHPDSNTGLAAC